MVAEKNVRPDHSGRTGTTAKVNPYGNIPRSL